MDNNFSAQVKEIISFSREEALRLGNDFIGTEHLMLSILKNKENIATQILNQFDVDYDLFRNELGVVKSNDVRSEYAEENDDDFDDEKKYAASKARPAGNTKSK